MLACAGVLLAAHQTSAQSSTKFPTTCKSSVARAVKPLPKLEYDCPESGNDSDDKILKLPDRLKALTDIEKELASFTDPAWWQADVLDLGACDLHGSAGPLTEEERNKLGSGDYSFQVLGNHQARLVILPDPCYQTGYSGSVIFLLVRQGNHVAVTKVVDGYYSRVDNSIDIDYATLNGRQIIEVSGANSFPPSVEKHFFEIDASGHAVPLKIFREGKTLTNHIYSSMLMAEPKDLGLPPSASELNIIRAHRLAPSFSAYEQDENGAVVNESQRFHRTIYHWNGKFYVPGK